MPVVYFLSGLTCTDENFITKAGAQRAAAEKGVAIVCPDTSPRGANVPGENDSWDLGTGAGFYVNATQEPWAKHYQMYSFVLEELPSVLNAHFPFLDVSRASVMGHSMGGHGALVLALRNPSLFRSVSAFAPICHPTKADWAIKCFQAYLGPDNLPAWNSYDAAILAPSYQGPSLDILIDQGSQDSFYPAGLLPQEFQASAAHNPLLHLIYRFQEGYDHSYYFISTFIDDHIAFHALHLQ